MIYTLRVTFIVVLFGITMSCTKKENTLFRSLPQTMTGITFNNEVVETEELNVMQYEYMYNGGGVAIGDFNGDGLPDIYLTGNIVENKLYINQDNFNFQDVTYASGVQGKKGWKTGASIADINGDGLLDIYVCYSGLGSDEDRSNQLFINKGIDADGIPKFEDQAQLLGLEAMGTYSTQAAFLDYDLDGDLDVFLLNHSKNYYSPFFNSDKLRNTRHPFFGNRLYQNNGGKFVDVSQEAGIHGSGLNFGLGVSIGDFNQDNWPDIYVSNDYVEQDFLYLNNSDGTFTDATKLSMGHTSKFSMGNDAADVNNDGQIDMVTLDMLPEDNYRQKILKGPDQYDQYQLAIENGYHTQQMRNMLQLNQGVDRNGIPRFSDIGQFAGISNTDWSWSSLLADYDGDGYKDLFITNGYLRDYTNMDFMKFEVNEAIEKVRRLEGIDLFGEKGKDTHAKTIYELVKKMPSTKIPNYIYKNNNGYSFENKTEEWGFSIPTVSTGAAYADFDNDGDLDLIVSNTNQPVSMYENQSNQAQNSFLKIKLIGDGKNTQALGAKIWVTTDSLKQFMENYNVKGYQSSVDPVLNFGLGQSNSANITVAWPNGNTTQLTNVKLNGLLTLKQSDSKGIVINRGTEGKPFFVPEDSLGIDFVHEENTYIDFKVNRLALKQNSKSGPKMAVADVNGDGFEDVFIGAAFGQQDVLYISDNGTYARSKSDCWSSSKDFESVGSVFFDADGDGDQDLYVVSGGSEINFGPEQLKDRLYINDGFGNFQLALENALPNAFSNGSTVIAGDYDNDGDQDLFVGGGSEPGNYPEAALGGILRNDSRPGQLRFSIVTNEVNPKLRQPGLTTDGIWTDLNNDGWVDLVLVGEWMPIQIFINSNGKLLDKTEEFGLNQTNGFWQTVEIADMDQDGDLDLFVGNIGNNHQLKASKSHPIEAFIGDFRADDVPTTIISSYIGNQRYPIATLEELHDAIPPIKKKFLKHEDYAKAPMESVFDMDQLNASKKFTINVLNSLYLENTGEGFKIHQLPAEAQFAPIEGIVLDDFTGDGLPDAFLAGNYYPFRVEYGPMDAGTGLLLKGDGKGHFSATTNQELGIWVEGDVRDAKLLKFPDQAFILLSKNSDSISAIRLNTQHKI